MRWAMLFSAVLVASPQVDCGDRRRDGCAARARRSTRRGVADLPIPAQARCIGTARGGAA